ncbi:hypothetical protein SLE2022_390930 [Rubroshorea leprosula]
MARRGYKLQEFVAHSADVNCLSMGKKRCRLLISGGDDNKVNLWEIGKHNSLMSFCGHTSSVESVAFDSEEVLVLAGSSSGVIKLWDLEEGKMVRGLTGHRSNCTSVEFHPFGEFFVTGSMDTNLKIWDIRKKGCIHTYKGHTRGINTIRFTPDGRWVVSGGFDNTVKVWDLTAGKLLHDFKFHEGHICSIDFHPLEFLLATGSADRTVKFWDLETFELIGSTRAEAAGVRKLTFHPDGRTLLCGSDDVLKVYSWEPVFCHDSVDIGWSTLGDLCIHEGKLLGCSYYQNSVGVWVADVEHIEPYGGRTIPEQNDCMEKKCDLNGSHSMEKVGIGLRSTLGLCSRSPDDETNDIKNIYVDTTAGRPVASQRVGSLNSPKLIPLLDPNEISNLPAEKQSSVVEIPLKSSAQAVDKSIIVPSIVPRNSPVEKDSSKSGRESIAFSRTKPGMLLRPAHARQLSNSKFEVEKLLATSEFDTLSNTKCNLDSERHLNSETKIIEEDGATKSCDDKCSGIKGGIEKFEKTLSPQATHNQETSNDFHDCNKDTNSVKFVNGVAVVRGRTRSLVERFERREKFNSDESETTVITPRVTSETDRTLTMMKAEPQIERQLVSTGDQNITESCLSESGRESQSPSRDGPILGNQVTTTESSFVNDRKVTPITEGQLTPAGNESIAESQFSKRDSTSTGGRTSLGSKSTRKELTLTNDRKVTITESQISRKGSNSSRNEIISRSQIGRQRPSFANDRKVTTTAIHGSRREPASPGNGTVLASQVPRMRTTFATDRKVTITESQRSRRESTLAGDETLSGNQICRPRSNFASDRKVSASEIQISLWESTSPGNGTVLVSQVTEMGSTIASDRKVMSSESQNSRRDMVSANDRNVEGDLVYANDRDITEKLMETHDAFLSTLRCRLTKLQVVRHFWERNDIKGAISALQKLPDHSVQADVISVLMEKMESFTLDLFSCLLPVLMSMLDSQMERHVCVSLEMVLKLVAVFGPVIHSTIAAPCVVGVDLHAEQRQEWCNQCFMQLQKIQKLLPAIARRGGLLARSAQELNLVLQQS